MSERRYRYPERSGISTRADLSKCLNCWALILFSLICLRLSLPSMKFGRETPEVGRGAKVGSAIPVYKNSSSDFGWKEGRDVLKRFANGSVYGGQSSTMAIALSRRKRAEPFGWQACSEPMRKGRYSQHLTLTFIMKLKISGSHE